MERLKTLLKPTVLNIISVIVLAVISLITVYSSAIATIIFTGGNASFAEQSYTAQLAKLNQIGFVQTVVIVIFWAIVGLVAYGIYLAISNAIVEARNEVVIETGYANQGPAQRAIRGVGIQLGCGLLLITGLIISALWLLPIWSSLFEAALFNLATPINIAITIGGILALALNYYLLLVLVRLMRMAHTL